MRDCICLSRLQLHCSLNAADRFSRKERKGEDEGKGFGAKPNDNLKSSRACPTRINVSAGGQQEHRNANQQDQILELEAHAAERWRGTKRH